MTWDQAKQLADSGAGMAIGSHAQSHPRLASLNEDAQYQELASSKQILENRIGRPIKALAYPYGWPGSYTAATMALAARAGYRVAFSSHEGINRFAGLDRYEDQSARGRIGRLGGLAARRERVPLRIRQVHPVGEKPSYGAGVLIRRE